MSKAISWQVNGDLNTRCVKAERDVIVPAATKYALDLVKKYGDLSKVVKASERKYLAFFKGDVKGFGSFARTRLANVASQGKGGKDAILYQEHMADGDYLTTLGQSKFCLLPRGIAGWYVRHSRLYPLTDSLLGHCEPLMPYTQAAYLSLLRIARSTPSTPFSHIQHSHSQSLKTPYIHCLIRFPACLPRK